MIRTIEVDWNDPSSLKKAIGKLQYRRKEKLRELGYDQIYFNGSKYNLDHILPCFNKIYDTDISDLYENATDETKKYYVYAHCNPLKPLDIKNNLKHLFLASKFSSLRFEPFYIGKGFGNRCNDLNRNDSHRKIKKNINKFNKDVNVELLIENLTEKEALIHEAKLIDILGLRAISNFGLLCNLDEGVSSVKRRKKYNDTMITRILERNGFR